MLLKNKNELTLKRRNRWYDREHYKKRFLTKTLRSKIKKLDVHLKKRKEGYLKLRKFKNKGKFKLMLYWKKHVESNSLKKIPYINSKPRRRDKILWHRFKIF